MSLFRNRWKWEMEGLGDAGFPRAADDGGNRVTEEERTYLQG